MTASGERSSTWKWWVCAMLLCASAINYMDRQTLANASVRITRELHLVQEQYGNLELGFGWAFAAGSLVFGFLADRIAVRWLYPIVLILWSGVGFATGLVHTYDGLLVCRVLLGFFEAGHWPCAIKTTQRLLEAKDRTMGNSVLQAGTSVGAIITPLMMTAMMTNEVGSWRFSFQVIGAIGIIWIVFWFALIRKGDLGVVHSASTDSSAGGHSFIDVLLSRRFLLVLLTISLINTSWQLLRAWLPKFLIEGRGYAEAEALYFNSAFFVATDIGCLGAGAATLWLHRRSFSVHNSRILVFFACAAMTALAVFASSLPKGWPLLAMLLVVGAGLLGLFPTYHALTQELTPIHQGKVTGIAGVVAWAIGSPAHKFFGRYIDQTGSFDRGLALAGLMPMIAFIALWLFWNWGEKKAETNEARA